MQDWIENWYVHEKWWVPKYFGCGSELCYKYLTWELLLVIIGSLDWSKRYLSTRQEKKHQNQNQAWIERKKANSNPNTGGDRWICGSIRQKVFVWLFWVSQRLSKTCTTRTQGIRRQTRKWL